MSVSNEYVLGQSTAAAERLDIQDAQFAPASEAMLDALNLEPTDRVVELGVGAGGFSRRVIRRLGPEGVLVGVDRTVGLLEQARRNLTGCGTARFEPVVADISSLGPWLEGANAVVCRTVLHHLPMAEAFLGRLHRALRPGVRVGFIEPEFRALLGRFTALEGAGRTELAVLRNWAEGITRFYEQAGLSPGVGATLAWALRGAGFKDVKLEATECPTTETVVQNLLLYYDEIRDKYLSMGIMTAEEIDTQKEQLQALPPGEHPAIWGIYQVTATA